MGPRCREALVSTHREIFFGILLNQTKIRLYLPCTIKCWKAEEKIRCSKQLKSCIPNRIEIQRANRVGKRKVCKKLARVKCNHVGTNCKSLSRQTEIFREKNITHFRKKKKCRGIQPLNTQTE